MCSLGSAGISAKGGIIRPLATMFFSRRVRRRLNSYDALPSGWFAVWFGSLLGFCHVLFPLPPDSGIQWPTQIGGSCDGGMLPLFLPPLHPDATDRKHITWPYKTVAELDTLRHWHDVHFTGGPIADFMAFAAAIQSVKSMQADTTCQTAMRVHFQQYATFTSLVSTLNMLDVFTQKECRYWLALENRPLTLYFIVLKTVPEPARFPSN